MRRVKVEGVDSGVAAAPDSAVSRVWGGGEVGVVVWSSVNVDMLVVDTWWRL